MTPDDHRQRPMEWHIKRLEHQGRKRRKRVEDEAAHQAALQADARAAVKAGMHKNKVALLLGISRPTLYKILRDD